MTAPAPVRQCAACLQPWDQWHEDRKAAAIPCRARRRVSIAWCRLTLRHRGHVHSDTVGVYWECSRCHIRVYTRWAEVNRQVDKGIAARLRRTPRR